MRQILSLAGLCLTVGCAIGSVDDPNVFKVALALPLTGTFADNGERHKAAVQMAFQDLERAGGVKGKSIRAVMIDCGDKMDTAAQRLQATLGPWDQPTQQVSAFISSSTACHEASMAYALQQKIPHLETSSGSDEDELKEYITANRAALDESYEFQVRALCRAEATMTPAFINMRTDMRRVVMLRGGHPHDLTHTSTVRAELANTNFAAQGGQVLNADDLVMPNDGPYTEALQRAIALNPDTIYFHLNGDTRNLNFFAELKRLNFQGKIVTCGMVRKPIVLDPVTPGFIDYLGDKLFFMMRGPVGGTQLDAFKANYLTFFGKDADTFAASTYDAAMLIGLGLAASTAEDGPSLRDAIGRVSREGTVVTYGEAGKALELIRNGADVNYEGASGTLDFNTELAVPSKYYVDAVKYNAAEKKGSYSALPNPVVLK